MKTIVFTGGSSLLAQSWIRQEQPHFNYILGLHKRQLDQKRFKTVVFDYDHPDQLSIQLQNVKADIVINCIGLTSVEACEEHPKLAEKINVELSKNIALACAKSKVKLVHISTDHLFDGTLPFANETTSKSPVNNYGKTKGEGEEVVQQTNTDALLIRTNFFGWGPAYKASFSDQILKNLVNGLTSKLFKDVYYTPISVVTLRDAIERLLQHNAKGVFNVTSNERISKYQFGVMLAIAFGYPTHLIAPISIDEMTDLTTRPKDMSLSNHKLSVFLNTSLPSLERQLEDLKVAEKIGQERMVIPYGRQDVSEKDIQSVVDVLRSDYITQGPTIQKFEQRVAEYCVVKHAYACNSATSALHIACLALGVTKGDLVWTSPISFVASSNCALYCNADVDFVDIDGKSYNMSPDALEKKLIEAKGKGRLPKVVIPVHLSGQSCDMDKIHALSKEYGFKIIEDASHAIGASYKAKPVGNCEYSDIAVFSFHPVKIITSGEGGAVVSNDSKLAEKVKLFRSHGIIRDKAKLETVDMPNWFYEQQRQAKCGFLFCKRAFIRLENWCSVL